jgi:tetratricopeptide (TPR) repeat protein
VRFKTLLGVVLLIAGLAGCSGDRASGPDVPEPDSHEMEPQVAALLLSARNHVLAQSDSAEAWGNLGALYDAHSLFDPAEICYRRAVELAPDDFRWAYLLAVVRDIGGGTPDELVPLFEAASRIDRDYVPVYVRLGDALARHGRNDEARLQLERAVALAPEIAVTHRLLGQLMLATGDLDTAERHLGRALELEPRDRATHTALAQLHMRRGRMELAEEVAERSQALQRINVLDDPVYGQWVFDRSMSSSRAFDRAKIRMRDGDFAAASRDLEVVVAARRANADVHAMLGRAYAELGRTDDAVAQLEAAVRLDPNHAARQQLEALRATDR